MKCCAVVVAGLTALAFAGCGAGTAPVTGTITYNGQPVADATVIFTPAGGSETGAKMATGRTDTQGKFSLGTEKPGDGARPGDYTVSVAPNLPEPAEGDYSAAPPPPFPQRYTNATGSDLKATVKAGSNDFPFELKD